MYDDYHLCDESMQEQMASTIAHLYKKIESKEINPTASENSLVDLVKETIKLIKKLNDESVLNSNYAIFMFEYIGKIIEQHNNLCLKINESDIERVLTVCSELYQDGSSEKNEALNTMSDLFKNIYQIKLLTKIQFPPEYKDDNLVINL